MSAQDARLGAKPGGKQRRKQPPLAPLPRDARLPLSFAQQRLWFLAQMAPDDVSYNVPYCLRLKGRLDVAALERTLSALVRRHEVLRTTFVELDGQPVQQVAADLVLPLPLESLEELPEDERASAVERRAVEEARRPFDLKAGPLLRTTLLRVAPDEHVLLLVMHHIACDGWSMGVLVRDLRALYEAFSRGAEPALPALPVQYADYARWQRDWLKGEVLEEQLAWWRQQLAGAPPVLELPADRPPAAALSSRGARHQVQLSAELSGALRELSRKEGVTPYMTLLAAFYALLSRYSGQSDVVVGSPIAGRNRRELEGLIGFFVNTLPLRVEVPAEASFRELLGRVRETCMGAYAHQDVPFEQLVDALQPARDLARTPLFQVMFVLQNAPSSALDLPGLSLDVLDVALGTSIFDLLLQMNETPAGWMASWDYRTELFDEATVARMGAHFARLLEGAVAHPEQRLFELPLLSEAERRQLLVEWSLANSRSYVLDRWMQPVPAGVLGELYLGGVDDRPGLAAERFVPDPFSDIPGASLYRTGDVVRFRADGTLEYLGRSDDQVKVRGYRIALGEVQAALKRCAGVSDAVVVARDYAPGDKRLVAYVVGAGLEAGALRTRLSEELPQHRVPSAIVVLEKLPLAPNGKVDREALPAPGAEAAGRDGYVAPRTALEEMVAGVWAPLLGRSRVGARDNFFELGGHSLLATQVVSRLREVLHREVPVRALFEAPTVAELAARLESTLGGAQGQQPAQLVPGPRDGKLPLSFAQQRLWFIEKMVPGGFAYNVPLFAKLEGRLDVAALERGLSALLRRHEVLRTTFEEANGQPVQRIAPEVAFAVPVESLERLPEAERARAAERRAVEESRRPFDLAQGPLVRAKLFRVAPDEHLLLLVMHHIVCDGWSLAVLMRELEALYSALSRGAEPALLALPVQYADYARWQREWLKGDALESQLDYWKQRLTGAPHALELPVDRPRPPVQSFNGALLAVRLPGELSGALRELDRKEGVTPFMTLLAAFYALLSRYSGQSDLVVGTPIAGRNRREVEGLIGFFVNTLALRVEAPGETSFRELLGRVRESCLGAYAHQDLPFEQLVEAVHPERDLSRSPLFQVAFVLQDAPSALELPGVAMQVLDLHPGVAKFDLTLFAREAPNGWVCFWEYNTDLFDEATVARMGAHYARLLEAAVAHPEQQLFELPLLSEEERHRVLVEWNDTRADFPRDACLHHLFEAQARRTPDAVAVEYADARLTYSELEAKANQLAHRLRGLGVGPEVLVALCMERSLELVVGILGVLKAGGAYVPLDPSYPRERLAFMLEDCAAPVLLVQHGQLDQLPEHHARVVAVDSEPLSSYPTQPPPSSATADNLAYVIYTSGSMGRPKGAMLQHRGVCNTVLAAARRLRLGIGQRALQMASPAFDASAWELFSALLSGATLVLASRDALMPGEPLQALMATKDISVITATPSALSTLRPEALPALRTAATVGEACPPELPSRWAGHVLLLNAYGPTEVSICTTISPGPVAPRPTIGRPLPNTTVYVLDARLQPLPVGVPGELFIGGVGLARGYLNRPELTAEKFIRNPFSTEPGARLYRSGDLVRYLPNGELDFLGRIDQQVKVRGFRIELGEVEAALAKHPDVDEVVVTAREDGPGGKRLVAYVVPREGHAIDAAALRAFLKESLPEYMLPSAFVRLEALPLTPNGKVDRKALPAPDAQGDERESYLAPRTAMEEVVAGAWAPLLGRSRVGVRDNFFELGGHSLLAAQVSSRLREMLHREVPVRTLFEAPVLGDLAGQLESLLAGEKGPQPPPLVPLPRDGRLPLSFAQQRLWFLEQFEPGGFAYNVPYAMQLTGRLDVAALERSLGELVQRHEVLRTTFEEANGQPVQRVAPQMALAMPMESLEADAVRQRVEKEARRPFDLEKGPLVRANLWRLAPEEHVLLLVMHHIVCDIWSLSVLQRELEALYSAFSRGAEPELPALPVQYADYATWQREWLKDEALETQLGWWKQRLAGAPPVLELPVDRPRPSKQTLRGAHLELPLPARLSAAVRELSRKEGVTVFMTFLAAFQALLARYTGQSDVVVGSPILGRNRREVEGLIGCFLNTLALRVEIPDDASFRQLLGCVREACLGAYAHQELPFEQLVDALQPVRDMARSPLFQVMFVHQSALPALELSGVSMDVFPFEPGMSKFDLTLFVRETATGLVSVWEYNTDLFDEATLARMGAHYARLLEGAVAHPEQRLSELPLLAEEERKRVLVEWNATSATYAPARGVHALFEASARRAPDAVAVSFGSEQWTYGELNQRANQLAHLLCARGVRPDAPVGLCVRRSLDLAVGVLGILKAGGAYVPLDPAYPRERLALMLESSRAQVLLAQSALRDALPASNATPLLLDSSESAWAEESVSNPEPLSGPDSLAYVIYTSGSTGVPKGVAMHHRPLLNLIRWQLGQSSAPRARTLQFSALSFDVSFQEMFSTWAAGGELVLVSEDVRRDAGALLELLERERIERLFLPFVALQNLAEAAEQEKRVPRHLRDIITAGEQLRITPALRRLMKRLGRCTLHNQYGPTETHVCTAFTLAGEPESWPDLPPIGRPISNTSIHLLDRHLEPVPVGVPGELYVGGAAVARGYLHRPELTQERFIPDSVGAAAGGWLYRTGDFARYLPDGNIEFLGRRDAQVKVRGYRIELAEVEAVLAQHPTVRDCIVEARDGSAGQKRLVAYVVGKDGKAPATGELRDFLKARLPEYMVPSAFVCLEAFPLTPSGKVARKALPAPDSHLERTRSLVGPRNALELRLVHLWEDVLGVHPIGVQDNFFELGGHSLLAIRLLARIRGSTGRALPVAALFQHATVESLAGLLRQEAGPWSPLVEIRGGAAKRPFFCVHAVGGTVLSYAELARLLGPEQPFYGLQSPGLEEGQEPLDSIEKMAALYVEAVRTIQPHGPYLLGGWSMGGAIAFEMAQQLRRQGEQVELLVLLDSFARLFSAGQAAPGPKEAARLAALFDQDLLRAAGQPSPPPDMPAALEEAGRSTASILGIGLQQLQALRRVFESNLRAAWRYVPQPYSGSLVSFEVGDSSQEHGWQQLASGGVEVHRLEGDHYSILRTPDVEALATHLRTCLSGHATFTRSEP